MRGITILALACLLTSPTLRAQTSKPISNGYVGKKLPELKGHDGSDSAWLGKTERSANVAVSLVVFTSYS